MKVNFILFTKSNMIYYSVSYKKKIFELYINILLCLTKSFLPNIRNDILLFCMLRLRFIIFYGPRSQFILLQNVMKFQIVLHCKYKCKKMMYILENSVIWTEKRILCFVEKMPIYWRYLLHHVHYLKLFFFLANIFTNLISKFSSSTTCHLANE